MIDDAIEFPVLGILHHRKIRHHGIHEAGEDDEIEKLQVNQLCPLPKLVYSHLLDKSIGFEDASLPNIEGRYRWV